MVGYKVKHQGRTQQGKVIKDTFVKPVFYHMTEKVTGMLNISPRDTLLETKRED